MEMATPWGWSEVDPDTMHRIRNRLAGYESMEWRHILGQQNHSMPVTRLCREAQNRLVALGLDDVDTLYSLRVVQRERIWGILVGSVLRVLWWDPYHEVYPVDVTGN